MLLTRPDIMFYVSHLCCVMQAPTVEALQSGLRLLGYLVATKHQGITFGGALSVPLGVAELPEHFAESRGLYGYSDSSWGKVAKPMGGYVVMLANGPVDWSARTMKVVADSTCEAETATASALTKAVKFVRRILSHVGCTVTGATHLLVDNSAMIQVVRKEGLTSRTRYFERCTLRVKDEWQKGVVEPVLVSTTDEVADIFTKALDEETFNRLRAILLNVSTTKVKRFGERAMKMLHKLNSIVRMYSD